MTPELLIHRNNWGLLGFLVERPVLEWLTNSSYYLLFWTSFFLCSIAKQILAVSYVSLTKVWWSQVVYTQLSLKFRYFTVGKNGETEQGLKVSSFIILLDLCRWILLYSPTHSSSVTMNDRTKCQLSFIVSRIVNWKEYLKTIINSAPMTLYLCFPDNILYCFQ